MTGQPPSPEVPAGRLARLRRAVRVAGVALLVLSATVVLLPAPWFSAATAAWTRTGDDAPAPTEQHRDELQGLLHLSPEELADLSTRLDRPGPGAGTVVLRHEELPQVVDD